MKTILSILAFLTFGFTSIAQTCLVTNQTGFDWHAEVFIAPMVTIGLPGGCAPSYPAPPPGSINGLNLGAMSFHAAFIIPSNITAGTCAPAGYCAYLQGMATTMGMPPIPPGHTIVRVILQKLPAGPPTRCGSTATVVVEVDEFTGTGTCAPREPKVIVCPGDPDGKFWFQLDHHAYLCTYCADYDPSGDSGLIIANW